MFTKCYDGMYINYYKYRNFNIFLQYTQYINRIMLLYAFYCRLYTLIKLKIVIMFKIIIMKITNNKCLYFNL